MLLVRLCRSTRHDITRMWRWVITKGNHFALTPGGSKICAGVMQITQKLALQVVLDLLQSPVLPSAWMLC